MSTQRNDPTFIPIEEFHRNPEEYAAKLKPGECFWESYESVSDGILQKTVLAGVVIGPEYKPRS